MKCKAMSELEKNIIDNTDDEILPVANQIWSELIRSSNEGNYGEFVKDFSYSLTKGLNEIEVGKQFVNSKLTRNLSGLVDGLGIIRRGQHVTVLYRQRSSKQEGEWLGRLVLGYEDGEIKIFGASIF
ncbi:MAG: hypothetical protein ACKVIX_09450, partial [Sphingomonadales bacterium]